MQPHTEPSLSVIIPTHNGRLSIRATVRALLTSSYQSLEVLVVCDGDGTQTRELLDDTDDARLIILQIPKGGSAVARNAGLREARHDWVAFVDDDDIPRPNWVTVWRARADDSTLAITAAVTYWHDGKPARSRACRLDPADATMSASTILAGAFWVRRNLADAVGGYDPSLRASQNQDFGLRLCDHLTQARVPGGISSTDEVVIDLHVQQASTRAARYGPAHADSARVFLQRYEARLQERPVNHASLLRIISHAERQAGNSQAARKAATRAWRLQPVSLKNAVSVFLAFFPFLGDSHPLKKERNSRSRTR